MAILKNKKKYTKAEKEILWEKYRADRSDKAVYNDLLEAYLPLVEVIASNTKAKLPSQIEIGDLLNDGFFGLVDAINKFDESKGWKFETYASNRIRGEINDRLRDYDWVSRYSRLKFKSVAQTEQFLTEELQREPTMAEIADRLGWDPEDVSKVQAQYNASYAVNIDEYISDSTHEFFSLEDMIADPSSVNVGFDLDVSELAKELESKMFSLEEHESIIVFLHVYEQFSFEDIAEILSVKATKVAKIYEDAVNSLRDAFGVR